jgi:hypothetical protein
VLFVVLHIGHRTDQEYAINQVCVKLDKRWSECVDVESMQTVVADIIDRDITNMDETFVHCGYIWN